MRHAYMTPAHPRWGEFAIRLGGPDGCDFHYEGAATVENIAWKCRGGDRNSFAAAILRRMGYSERFIELSLEYFHSHGGGCDCEIVFNISEGEESGE